MKETNKEKLNFYEYTQNNSGGSFITNKDLAHRVFIEARTAEKSKETAIKLGIYFDGVADGTDCDCCGDRWNEPDELAFPYRHGSFDRQKAEEIAEKYNADFGKTEFKFMGTHEPDPNKYDVVFRNVESYAKYLEDAHGWAGTKPDYIIHYKNSSLTPKITK